MIYITIIIDLEAYEDSTGVSGFKIGGEMNELWPISEGPGEVK